MAAGSGASWCVRLHADAASAEAVETALAGLGGAAARSVPAADGAVTVDVYCTEEPARAEVVARLSAAARAAGIAAPDFRIERLPDIDWVAESRKALPPVQAGPFYVYGGHVSAQPPTGAIPLRIEASLAFGTGHHETTRGCLMALAELKERREITRALDLGCGTGILAIAVAKLWGCPVVAVDNDPEAVRLARENAAINGVADVVQVHLGEGYACPAVGAAAPYDVIVANIVAGPLIAMADDLKRHLAPGGVAVLSGLLLEQAEDVLRAHRPLRLIRETCLGDWPTLVLG